MLPVRVAFSCIRHKRCRSTVYHLVCLLNSGCSPPVPDPVETEDEEASTPHATRRRPPNERESRRPIDVLTATTSALPPHVHVISIADREADFYDFLATGIDNKLDLLIRAVHDRALDQEGSPRLRETVQATAPLGSVTVDVPRSGNRASYRATLELHACPVSLCAPKNAEHHGKPSLPLWAILAQQTGAPRAKEKPITWWLLTTLAVPDPAARQLLTWYTFRWRVERFHDTLKSG